MYNVKFKLWGLTGVLALLIVFQACKKSDDTIPSGPDPITYERGDIAKVTSLGIYSTDMIKQIVNESTIDFSHYVTHSVEVLSVQYYTVDHKGNLLLASGAIFVPQNRSAFPLLSLQHGTETKRNLVASVDPEYSSEGKIALLTASIDYVTLVPDYLGFGVSNEKHPYLHASSLVPSVIDFIIAGKTYCQENDILLKDELFLSGYSEGGYVTLHTQKALEEDYDMKITAVAPLAGPYDLKGTFGKIFGSQSYASPAYVAYFLTAYNELYGWDMLDVFFQEPYASKMESLFNGSYSWGEITNALPEALDDMIQPDFFTHVAEVYIPYNDEKSSTGLARAICENTCLDWVPKAPLHFFHGDCDDVVYCCNATNAVNAFKANGATDVQLTIIAGGNHETSGTKALDGALAWFQSFRPDQ
jgi:hypothetical protein